MKEHVILAFGSFFVWAFMDRVVGPNVSRALQQRGVLKKKSGRRPLYCHSIAHHMLTGGLAAYVLYLETISDVVEPERSFKCLGPVSVLSTAVPSISLGYGFHDLLDGIHRRDVSVQIHGTIMVLGILALLYNGVAHHTCRIFTINLSTILLNMRALDFGRRANLLVDLCFVASFTLLRGLILPLWWFQFLSFAFRSDPSTWGACMKPSVAYVAVIGGVVLHSLNAYWLVKIIERAISRIKIPGGISRVGTGVVSACAKAT